MNYRSPNVQRLLLTPNRVAFAGLIILFLVSRMVFSQTGIRFDTFPLYTSWQFVDPELLRTDLLQSIFYLHSQPPLFNLFLGCVLKAVPEHLTTAFRVVFMLLGLTLPLSMFALMRRLGVFTWLAFTLTTLFVISPGFILYENWLFYTMPLALFWSRLC